MPPRVARQEELLAARDNSDDKVRIVAEALICWSQILLILFPYKAMLVLERSAVADFGWTSLGRHLANSRRPDRPCFPEKPVNQVARVQKLD